MKFEDIKAKYEKEYDADDLERKATFEKSEECLDTIKELKAYGVPIKRNDWFFCPHRDCLIIRNDKRAVVEVESMTYEDAVECVENQKRAKADVERRLANGEKVSDLELELTSYNFTVEDYLELDGSETVFSTALLVESCLGDCQMVENLGEAVYIQF